jgi:predicted ATPase
VSVRRSTFLGRDAELERLAGLVGEHRLVTVTGAGGIGKSRLVEERLAAFRTADRPVLVASLTNVEPGADADALSGELGMPSPEALALSVCDIDALVVLDNCEHVVAGAADFARRVLDAAPRVSVLATSRVPLGLEAEQLLVLEPLALPGFDDHDGLGSPATALFVDRALAAGAGWERTDEVVAAIQELCRRLDGLPLAIELAAARTRALSPVELLELMERRLDTLHARHPDRPERHRSLRAAIAVSVDLLDEESRDFFNALGVFAGPFDLELAHALAGPVPGDRLHTVDLVGELVERSLVVAIPAGSRTRYRLLELVAEYAADQLDGAGTWDATCEQFATVMMAEADHIIVEGTRAWTDTLVARSSALFGNIAAAIDWCLLHDATPDRAFRLYLATYATVHQTRAGDVRALGERILTRWPREVAPWRAEATCVLATAYAIASGTDRARFLARAALADAALTGIGRVLTHRALLFAALAQRDNDAALEQAQRGRAEAESEGAGAFAREFAGTEAALLDCTGNSAAGVALAGEVVAASRAAGDPITEVWGLLVGATIAIRGGRYDEARALLVTADTVVVGGWWGGMLRRTWALLESFEHGWDAARPKWRVAAQRAARLGDLGELARTLRAASHFADDPSIVDALRALPVTTEVSLLPALYDDDGGPVIPTPEVVVAFRNAIALLGDDSAPRLPNQSTAPAPARYEIAHTGDLWELTYRSGPVRVRDLKGLHDIARLLERPHAEIHCLELVGAATVAGDAGPALDERARREYQARIVELQTEIDDARAANDPVRAERAETELDRYVQQLSEAFGLGGRARATGSNSERARSAVTYRIRAAVKKIAEADPELGRHLDNTIRTGTWCSYQPEGETQWVLTM